MGDRLRSARSALGLSARELSRLAGLSPTHVSGLESGPRVHMEARVMAALAEVLGCSLDWLVRGVGELRLLPHHEGMLPQMLPHRGETTRNGWNAQARASLEITVFRVLLKHLETCENPLTR